MDVRSETVLVVIDAQRAFVDPEVLEKLSGRFAEPSEVAAVLGAVAGVERVLTSALGGGARLLTAAEVD